MKHLAPSIFRAFSCAAGACPDSCCRAGWEIVPDEETLALYETLPGPDGDRVRAGIVPACRGGHRPPEAPDDSACRGGHWPPEAPDDSACRGGHWPPEAPDDSACRGGHWPPKAPEEPLLRQDENRVCVLLDADGLCHVQRHFGHGALCRVCREYPRFHREFGNLTEHGLSLSCPTAYALATSQAPAWEAWEDEAPIVPNELDPAAYLRLRKGRELALELLTRENIPFGQRLLLVRRLAAALEAAPERRIRHDYEARLRRWSTLPTQRRDKPCLSALRSKQSPGGRSIASGRSKRFAPGKLHSFRMPDKHGLSLHPEQEGAANCRCLARRFLELEILSPVWRDALERFLALAEAGELPENPRPPLDPEPYARWLWYELYKYWLDALDDGALLARVDRALLMLALGLAMDQALPWEGPFLRRLSREIEHCEENLAALLALCRKYPADRGVLGRVLLDI